MDVVGFRCAGHGHEVNQRRGEFAGGLELEAEAVNMFALLRDLQHVTVQLGKMC